MALPRANLQAMLPALLTGEGGKMMTPEEIARQRLIAAALLQQDAPITNWGEGAAHLVDSFSGAMKTREADKAEKAGTAESQRIMQSLLGGMGGAPAASPGSGAGFGMAALPAAAGGPAAAVPAGETASYVRDGLMKRGLPGHVADAFVVNFQDESGLNPGINEAAPIVPGSRGGYGLYQLTGPRRRAYESFAAERGIPLDSVDGQLDFMMSELQGPEAGAAKSILAAPDTATAAQAIVNKFLRPSPEHRQSRASRYAGLGTSEPVQVASADPSFMPGSVDAGLGALSPEDQQRYNERIRGPMPTSVPYAGPGAETGGQMSVYDDKGIRMENAGTYGRPAPAPALPQQTTALAPLPAPQTVAANPVPPADPAQRIAQQMAQADPTFDGFARDGGNVQGAPAAPAMPGTAQMAQGSAMGGINPAIMEALSSPYADAQTKQIAGMLLNQQMEQQAAAQDPMRALQLQKGQLEIEALRNPRPDPAQQLAREKFQWEQQQAGITKPTADIQEYEFAKGQGYQGDFVQFQLDQKKAGATSINNNVGGDSGKFFEAADKKRGETVAGIAEAGDNAQRSLIQIEELDKRLSTIGTGGMAGLKQIAGSYGIPVSGLDDIQAATALVNQLVPGQRPPGSGTMSDADVELFKQSLPRIINSEGGNKKILGAMRGIAQYDLQRGQIANAVLNREITPAEGQARMNAIPNPLAEINKAGAGAGTPAPVDDKNDPAPAGVDPSLWKFMPPEDRKLFR